MISYQCRGDIADPYPQINNFFGQQAYINRFGHTRANGTKFIPANWQAAINNGNAVGSIIGLLINGYCQSRYGSRRTYMCAQVSMAATSK